MLLLATTAMANMQCLHARSLRCRPEVVLWLFSPLLGLPQRCNGAISSGIRLFRSRWLRSSGLRHVQQQPRDVASSRWRWGPESFSS